jgi:hypothetical protein
MFAVLAAAWLNGRSADCHAASCDEEAETPKALAADERR